MSGPPTDPGVQSLLDEAELLPECAAKDALLEQAAARAEALGDLDTAWEARCGILSSSASHAAPRFETLFMCLAWCLAVSDRDPDRFASSRILWQYKWVAEAAPKYASIPRAVLTRLIDDMDDRFIRAGWGRRAGLHKRMSLYLSLGEHDRARALVDAWHGTPRDRGADCIACEASSLAELLIALGDEAQALREARPIILGRLSCATVPHSTFGSLLLPLLRQGRHAQARALYDKGRRLVAAMEDGGAQLIAPYCVYAAFIGETEHTVAMLRARLPEASALHSDEERMHWFGHAALALDFLARRGVTELDLPHIPTLVEAAPADTLGLAEAFRAIAIRHAAALDARNGNTGRAAWLRTLADHWNTLPPPPIA